MSIRKHKTKYAVFSDTTLLFMIKAMCQKCGKSWKPHSGKFPKTCPFCSSSTWTQPKRGE